MREPADVVAETLGTYQAQEDAQDVLAALTAAGWFLVRPGEGITADGERVELENVHSAPCSVSYCAGANGWGGPEYPTCDGCNADGTITTTVTTSVEDALFAARPVARPSGEPTPDDDEKPDPLAPFTEAEPGSLVAAVGAAIEAERARRAAARTGEGDAG